MNPSSTAKPSRKSRQPPNRKLEALAYYRARIEKELKRLNIRYEWHESGWDTVMIIVPKEDRDRARKVVEAAAEATLSRYNRPGKL